MKNNDVWRCSVWNKNVAVKSRVMTLIDCTIFATLAASYELSFSSLLPEHNLGRTANRIHYAVFFTDARGICFFPLFSAKMQRHAEAGGSERTTQWLSTWWYDQEWWCFWKMLFDASSNGVPVNSCFVFAWQPPQQTAECKYFRRGNFVVTMA